MIRSGKWLLALVSVAYVIQTCESMNMVCYTTNWSQYRQAPGKFFPENLDPNLCTHIIYAFAKIDGGVLAAYEWNDLSTDWSRGLYARTMDLRSKNPSLKILLAVGGWNAGSAIFSTMVSTAANRKTFIDSALKFIVDNKFDGLDMDWEYPANRDSEVKEDRELFTTFLSELRAAFAPKNLLITAAVGAGKSTIDTAYEVAKMAELLDMVNLMTYDLHGAWENTTDLNAPLYARKNDADPTLNVAWAAEYYVKLGTPKSKLNIGLATYGRTFTLADASKTGIGAPAKNAGEKGKYTGEPGFLSYYEICQNLQNGWTRVYDDVAKAPYAYSGTQWVGYDDVQSLTEKVNYILGAGYGGVMIWTFDNDDFPGTFCNQGKYPLLNKIKNLISSGPAPATSAPTTAAATTAAPATTTAAATSAPVVDAPVTTQQTTQSTAQTTTQSTRPGTTHFVCYTTNWSQYRQSPGKFFPENLDANLCTHIIYAFAKIEGGVLAAYEWNDLSTDWARGLYARTMDLKSSNPNLKILLAVGGWNAGSAVFSTMVSTAANRKTFIDSAVKFIVDNKFDGLDMDWEYPANRDSQVKEDRELFTVFLSELRAAFAPKNLLITAAVGAGKSTVDTAYEVAKMCSHLDMVNLMTYDLHGSWDTTVDVQAPLFARPDDKDPTLNIAWAADYYVKLGCPKSKLNIGLATYGRTFTLASASQTGIGAPAKGTGLQGKFTGEPGFLSYYEICQNLQNGWTRAYDDVVKTPYAYSGTQWVGYDDLQSIGEKTNYILGQGFGGIMVWTFDNDDFTGTFCNQGKYPLLNLIKKLIGSGPAPATSAPASTQPTTQTTANSAAQTSTQAAATTASATTKAPSTAQSTTTTTATTTAEPSIKSGDFRCPNGDGYYPDVSSGCKNYFVCMNMGTDASRVLNQSCPGGLIFDSKLKVCNYPSLVSC